MSQPATPETVARPYAVDKPNPLLERAGHLRDLLRWIGVEQLDSASIITPHTQNGRPRITVKVNSLSSARAAAERGGLAEDHPEMTPDGSTRHRWTRTAFDGAVDIEIVAYTR